MVVEVVGSEGDKKTRLEEQDGGEATEPRNKLGLSDGTLILISMAIGFISHAYNMFRYPIYLGDEGIYMEQAWSLIQLGKLSPYTYFYDHAPAGWMLIAGWIYLLPARFHQFGMAINSGRVLMLLLHVISVALLYKVAKKLSGSDTAAFLTALIFSLSPLGLYYQRMVLLDNIMVFWLLMSLYFLTYNNGRLTNVLISGLLFGIALLTKENAVFFLPVMAYMVYLEVKNTYRYRFGLTGWVFAWSAVLSFYPLYAFLKSELLPAGTSFILSSSPVEHVSLVQTWLWQLSRRNSSILDLNSQFWVFFNLRWWPRDAFIIGGGIFAVLVNFWIGLNNRTRYGGNFLAALLAMAYGFYIIRGSVMLEFYLTPLLPFLAMNAAMLIDLIINALSEQLRVVVYVLGVLLLSSAFIYTARDHYTLNITQEQVAQLQWIRTNIPPSAKIAIDDDLWVDLHDQVGRAPVFPYAHSHWKVQGDPDIREKLLHDNWRNLDYIVLSDDLLQNMERENTEDFMLTAIRNSRPVAQFEKGDVLVQIRQVNK